MLHYFIIFPPAFIRQRQPDMVSFTMMLSSLKILLTHRKHIEEVL